MGSKIFWAFIAMIYCSSIFAGQPCITELYPLKCTQFVISENTRSLALLLKIKGDDCYHLGTVYTSCPDKECNDCPLKKTKQVLNEASESIKRVGNAAPWKVCLHKAGEGMDLHSPYIKDITRVEVPRKMTEIVRSVSVNSANQIRLIKFASDPYEFIKKIVEKNRECNKEIPEV